MADNNLPRPSNVGDIYLAAILDELKGFRNDLRVVAGPPEADRLVEVEDVTGPSTPEGFRELKPKRGKR